MSYTIKIDRPTLEPGAELLINGLGVVKNGQEFFVDDALAETFRHANSRQTTENDPDDGHLIIKTTKGPTLLQAFEKDPDVHVSTSKQEKSKKPEPVADPPDLPVSDEDPNSNPNEGE